MLDPGFSSGGERYHLGVRLLNGLISQQWYPWQQGIYLSAGIFLNGNRLSLQPSSANGGHYTLATPAKVTFRPISPYLGVGYSQRFSRHSHWSFNVSAGAAYQGSPTIRVTHGIGPHPQWEQHAYASEVSNLRQSLGGFRWYPVVEINVRYRW
ncbi:hypothetical protein GCD22_01664 [Acidithiobacillus thiooxidans ATCC 19377]|uniref:Uncharacterized protein n=2 Tax=Acidithiobacillus thiooxidans TaxID=930 RepID=A0A5P9XPX8_ACITH|nr:hypothetical protein GCD22_01664 [Acidithiobacillus thiooxidans ATCC 19377]